MLSGQERERVIVELVQGSERAGGPAAEALLAGELLPFCPLIGDQKVIRSDPHRWIDFRGRLMILLMSFLSTDVLQVLQWFLSRNLGRTSGCFISTFSGLKSSDRLQKFPGIG